MIALEFAAVIVLQSVISGHLVWPWDFALSLNTHTNYAVNFVHSFLNRSSWYIVIWLLPLGLVRIREFPRPWGMAAGLATLCALGLNAYHSPEGGGGGGIGRYIFDIAGLRSAVFQPQLAWQAQAVCHSHPPSKTNSIPSSSKAGSIPSRRDVC